MRDVRLPLAIALAIAALACAAHHPVLDAGFAFDDPAAVTGNPLVTGDASLATVFTQDFWGERPGFDHIASWRPLTVLSLRLDHRLGGGAALPFHATNLALHVVAAWLAFALARRLEAGVVAAGLVGVVVAVHPVFGEAVASVVGRGDLLVVTLGLGALLVAAARRVVPTIALLALALLAKESAVVFVAAAGALWWREPRRLAALGVLGLAWYAGRAAVVGHLGGEVPAVDNPIAALDPGQRLLAGLATISRYAEWSLVPRPVPPDMAAAVDPLGTGGWRVTAGALAGGLLTWGLWRAWRRQDARALVGLVLAGASLVLLSNALFPLPTPAAGRLAYAPAVGATLWLVPAIAGAALPWRLLAAAWLALGVPATLEQARAWQSDAQLFAMGVEREPDSVRSRVNLAVTLLDAGQATEARRHLELALALAAHHPLALSNLALAAEREGRPEEAWDLATRAVTHETRPGQARANLCAFAVDRHRLPAAEVIALCEAAVAAVPERPEPTVNLARALARPGRTADADALLDRAATRWPDSAFVAAHHARHLVATGRLGDAIAHQRRAVSLAPDDPRHGPNLVAILLQHGQQRRAAGDPAGACAAAREATALAPGVRPVAERASLLCADL